MTLGGIPGRLAALTFLAGLAGCNLVDGMKAPPHEGTPGGQSVSVSLTPPSPTVQAGATVSFVATVTGSAQTSVSWSVTTARCGTIDATGLYTAPAAAASCQVVATAVADPTRSAVALVTVTAGPPLDVTVTVSPSPGNVNACKTLTFSATVTGTTNRAVTWRVQEASGGSIGASSGVYTAPTTAGTYHVIATSNADPSRQGTAAVAVTERVVSVAVTPGAASLSPGGTRQFTATVITTCGSFAAVQTLHADGTLTE